MQTLSLSDPNALPERPVAGPQKNALTEVSPDIPMEHGAMSAAGPAGAALDAFMGITPRAEASASTGLGLDHDTPFGVFYGLRSVFLLYLGAGIVAAVGYELWCLLTR